MRPKTLASFVSGGIARSNPIENTPEFEAALAGQQVIPDTWGGYATRLMDLLDLEPHEAVGRLGLTSDDLADPTILFEQTSGYLNSDPETVFIKRFAKEAGEDLEVEAKRLRKIVDIIKSGFKIPDQEAADAEADAIQDKIEEDFHQEGVDVLCAKRDALNSGTVIGLDEFVKIMLGSNVLNDENPSELAKDWIRGTRWAIEETLGYDLRHFEPDTPIRDIILGDNNFQVMKDGIDTGRAARERAEERWEEIAPVFVARKLSEFPLIAGTEK